MLGTVFEIQKFALHDGPGIRTVVFLKGCTLRCDWCSNPESYTKMPQLLFDKNKCNDCFDCIPKCGVDALSEKEGKLIVDFNSCTNCGDCTTVCLPDALKIVGRQSDAHAIIVEVIKDRAYFDRTGGGLTLSGGEALMQIDFSTELLKLSKIEKLHTCVETAGFVPKKSFESVLPYVDLFLFDFKLNDAEKHRKYTGSSNEKILENLKFLCSENIPIILRCPIIPEVNDHISHFKSITKWAMTHDNIQSVEVLPYHNWGSHKNEQLGMTIPKIKSPSIAAEKADDWVETLIALGCSKAKRA